MNYTKKIILGLIWVCAIPSVSAQVGYIHQDSVLRNLPGYVAAVEGINAAQAEYEKEIAADEQQLAVQMNDLFKTYEVKENENIAEVKKRMSAVDTVSLNILMTSRKMLDQKRRPTQVFCLPNIPKK